MNKWTQRILRYVVVNGVFAVCLYYGFFEGPKGDVIEGAKNLALFVGWLTGVSGVLLLFAMNANRKQFAKLLYEKDWKPSVPLWVDVLFDSVVVMVFAWHAHYVLAAFYVASIIAGSNMRECQKEHTFEMLSGRTK